MTQLILEMSISVDGFIARAEREVELDL